MNEIIQVIHPNPKYKEDYPVIYADGRYWKIDEDGTHSRQVTIH